MKNKRWAEDQPEKKFTRLLSRVTYLKARSQECCQSEVFPLPYYHLIIKFVFSIYKAFSPRHRDNPNIGDLNSRKGLLSQLSSCFSFLSKEREQMGLVSYEEFIGRMDYPNLGDLK